MLKFDTLVFPTDFSPCSDQALDLAVPLARHFDSELHLLHVTVLVNHDPEAERERFPEETALLARLEQVTWSMLGDLGKGERLAKLRVRQAWRSGLSASDAILDYSSEVGADGIVMGTHGRRGPRRWLLGSVTESVLRRATCPVLVARERAVGSGRKPTVTILVPIDFSETTRSTLAAARQLADLSGARLALLHVVDLPVVPTLYGLPLADLDLGAIEARALSELEALAERAGLSGPNVELAIDNGSPAAAIIDHATLNDCGLIVMPARSRRRSGLLGNTTEGVLRRATCPVLTLPTPPDAKEGSADD